MEELPPWHVNRASRLIKTPKLHLGDTGLACALLGRDAAALMKDRTAFGRLLETFVFQELRRHASWHEDDIRFHHFRDRDGFEVDIVMERRGHELAGIEVKASVTASDFRGLRKLKDAAGDSFRCGSSHVRRRDPRELWRQPVCRADPLAMGDDMIPKEMNDMPARTTCEVRAKLDDALRLDLVGPWSGHDRAEEKLPS